MNNTPAAPDNLPFIAELVREAQDFPDRLIEVSLGALASMLAEVCDAGRTLGYKEAPHFRVAWDRPPDVITDVIRDAKGNLVQTIKRTQ